MRLSVVIGAVAAAGIVAACTATPSGTPSATPSVPAQEPSPSAQAASADPASASPSAEPSLVANPDWYAMAGITMEATVEWARDFGLDCERDLPAAGIEPPADLRNAFCTVERADGNARLEVRIAYWPDDRVLFVEAVSSPLDDSGTVTTVFRHDWLTWLATLEYAGADPAVLEPWLLANTLADCPQGCLFGVGDGSWFHAVGLGGSDQLSVTVPG